MKYSSFECYSDKMLTNCCKIVLTLLDGCKKASAGSYVPSAGRNSSLLCRKGTFQDQEGQSKCKGKVKCNETS